MMVTIASCSGGNSQELSASTAKSLLQKEMKRMHADQDYAKVAVGYYECNDDAVRLKLRKLAASEMVTYSCERIQKPERVKKTRRVQRQGYFYSYYDTESYWVNDTVTTYFVTVALTEKGQKLVVDSIPDAEPTDDVKEMKLDFEPDMSKFPESSVPEVEFADENQGQATDVEEPGDEDFGAEDVSFSAAPAGNGSEASAYELAKAKESVTTVNVKSHVNKIVKVRNIVVESVPAAHATGEVLLEVNDATPFGRILNGAYDGTRNVWKDVTFVYYQDKKWKVGDIE